MALSKVFDATRNTISIGESRLVFHCHHYNLFLQRTLSDALGEQAVAVQVEAARGATQRLLAPVFAEVEGFEDKLASAARFFAEAGFGLADPAGLSRTGGTVTLPTSHYAVGHLAKWGRSERPVCHFAAGYWAGALGAALQLQPAQVRSTEEVCCATEQSAVCRIRIEVI